MIITKRAQKMGWVEENNIPTAQLKPGWLQYFLMSNYRLDFGNCLGGR